MSTIDGAGRVDVFTTFTVETIDVGTSEGDPIIGPADARNQTQLLVDGSLALCATSFFHLILYS